MIKRKYLYNIVIALCLWLPLQAMAGQWLHCAKMASLFDKSVFDKKEIIHQPSKTVHHSCHDVATAQLKSVADAQDQSPQTTCNHCQFVCHWQSVILLSDLPDLNISLLIDYSDFNSPIPRQPSLETPQRPPQVITA